MTERFKAFWLGIFVLGCAALIIWLVLFLRPSVGDGKKTLKIRFSNIEKVAVGTRVTLAGKPVGEVVEINEIVDAREQPTDKTGNLYFYELVVKVDSHVTVFNYDDIIFSTAGLLGEKTIAIVPKQAPRGSPPPVELKDGVLYARSTDKLDEALTKLLDVADVFEQAMCEMLCFFKENGEGLNTAVVSFNKSCREVEAFFGRANECDLAGGMGKTFANLSCITNQVASGQGTLGRIVYQDTLYYNLDAALSRMEQVFSDIHNFGLFFQFNGTWQKQRKMEERQMMRCTGSAEAYEVFNDEVLAISQTLKRVEKAINKMKKKNVPKDDPRLADLLGQIESLEENLKQKVKDDKPVVSN